MRFPRCRDPRGGREQIESDGGSHIDDHRCKGKPAQHRHVLLLCDLPGEQVRQTGMDQSK